jgi:hypothetical protein
MPIPTDYTSLVTEVGNYLHRSDLTAEIPTFISYAEQRVAHDLKITPLITNGTVNISAGGSSVSLPTGFIGMVSVKITGAAKLHYIPPDTYDSALSQANGLTVPTMYTMIGSSIYVSPAWTAGGTLTLNYFKKEVALSGSNTTNWYVTNVPHMLTFAALLEATPFVKDAQDEIMKWEKMYEYARDRANDQYNVVDPFMRSMQYSAGKAKALTPGL